MSAAAATPICSAEGGSPTPMSTGNWRTKEQSLANSGLKPNASCNAAPTDVRVFQASGSGRCRPLAPLSHLRWP